MSIKITQPTNKHSDCRSCSTRVKIVITIFDSVLEDNEYGIIPPSESFKLCVKCAEDLAKKITKALLVNCKNRTARD